MKKLGLIINPIAGMGGSVGLKGTDHMVETALLRGAVPRAGDRTQTALTELLPIKEQLEILTYPGAMGGDLAQSMGFTTTLLTEPEPEILSDDMAAYPDRWMRSTESDTVSLAEQLKSEQTDLILFAGGDGTARDIYRAVGIGTAALGIPAGVKIHSPVYAKNPKSAGALALLWLTGKISKTKDEEVLDIDEDLYRQEMINTRLYGYLSVPIEKALLQNRKAPTPLSDIAAIESIAHEVIEEMEPDVYYLIGAGTTTRGIMYLLNLENTLIGVDLIYNKQLIAADLYGDEILKYIKGKRTKLIVTVTGGQGYLFGRGNQQLTPEVIKEVSKENIVILATKTKISELHGQAMLVDTFDEELNRYLCGYYRTITAYREFTVCRVSQ